MKDGELGKLHIEEFISMIDSRLLLILEIGQCPSSEGLTISSETCTNVYLPQMGMQ